MRKWDTFHIRIGSDPAILMLSMDPPVASLESSPSDFGWRSNYFVVLLEDQVQEKGNEIMIIKC